MYHLSMGSESKAAFGVSAVVRCLASVLHCRGGLTCGLLRCVGGNPRDQQVMHRLGDISHRIREGIIPTIDILVLS